MPVNDVLPLVLFAMMVLSLSLHALAASGHFPRRHGAAAFARGFGRLALFGSIAVALASLLGGVTAGFAVLPWYAVVIGGGLALLMAPLILQKFPDSFVDGIAPLLGFALAGAALALLLTCIALRGPVLP